MVRCSCVLIFYGGGDAKAAYRDGNAKRTDLEIVRNRIIEEKIASTQQDTVYSDKHVAELLKNINLDGSWNDINYSSQESALWEPHYHLDRNIIFAIASINKYSTYFNSIQLKQIIQKSLEYWITVKPTSENWWWNIIGEPQRLGLLLNIISYGFIPIEKQIKEQLYSRIPDNNPFDYSGANRSDVGIANLYKSLYVENEPNVNIALDAIFSSVEYGDGSSFKKDGSFMEDGIQLYIGGYAEVLLSNILHFAQIVKGTKFSISDEKIDIMSNFVRGIYANSIRGKTMAYNCHGRSVSRQDQLNKENSVPWIKKLKDIDSPNNSEYDEIINRLGGATSPSYSIKKDAKHYYMSDYTTQTNPDYNIAVRTVSVRTRKDEIENGEGLKNYFLSDGSTNIVRTGQEYYNIMPLWDYLYIPGTTAPDMGEIPKSYFMQKGMSEFAGGVTDSVTAVVALDYFDYYNGINTGGRKGYFLLDDMMVCLGNCLSSDKSFHTAVNQCWASDNDIIINLNGKKHITGNQDELSEFHEDVSGWILHDNIGYVFPVDQDVKILLNKREGRWYDINHGMGSKDLITGRVFQLSLGHDNYSDYQYIVIPETTENELIQITADFPIKLVNESNIQAVYDMRTCKYGIIFFESGDIEFEGISLSVSNPCILLVKKVDDQKFVVNIADPSQSLENLSINISDKNGYFNKFEVQFDKKKKGKTESVQVSLYDENSINEIYEIDRCSEKIFRYNLSGQKYIKDENQPYIEIKGNRRELRISQ